MHTFHRMALALPLTTLAISLDPSNRTSITSAASTIAYDVQAYYTNNATDTQPVDVGTFPSPYYWWQAGAIWGAMIDYWAYTHDTSYVANTQQAILAQVGPNDDFLPTYYHSSEGNDDVGFWGFAVMSAVEYGFPVPAGNVSGTWLQTAENVWSGFVGRWNTSSCNGGLKWQIFSDQAGYDYKNSIANAAFLQLSARLARYTGQEVYAQWAEKVWDWLTGIGLVDAAYNVYDGSDDTINCTGINHDQWSYNPGALLYGAAMMYNYTGGASAWEGRVNGLLGGINRTFFSPAANATNIMYEPGCEPANTCDTDQYSFKAYMSRWLAKSVIVAPSIEPTVRTLLQTTAVAAAQTCTGGDNGRTCGTRWYVGGYDGQSGLLQELTALETIQSLLLLDTPIVPLQQA